MPTNWHVEELASPEKLAAETRAAFPDLDLNHDVAWLSAQCEEPERSVLVLTARDGDRLMGLAPFEVHPSQIQFGIGELTVAKRRVLRFAIECEPLLAEAAPEDALVDCYRALAQCLPGNSAVFLRGVPEGSRTHALLNQRGGPLRSIYFVIPHGPRYLRCRIRWNGSFETYLQSLGKVTRKDLRRTLKKAESEFGDKLRLERFESADASTVFVRLAAEVSDKTYQAKVLGLGISQDRGLRDRLRAAAHAGRFRGHILFLGDEPVSFHYGYVYRARFYMVDGGFDPRWSKSQLGILTFMLVLQDLEKQRDPVTVLDYLYGDGAYKRRTSNDLTPERHFYLIKKSVSGAILTAAMISFDTLSRGLGDAVGRLGYKDFIKRKFRRLARGFAGSHPPGDSAR
jgi:CelD/BcsL family acetyltransferase involved in cellulose biosynthesis